MMGSLVSPFWIRLLPTMLPTLTVLWCESYWLGVVLFYWRSSGLRFSGRRRVSCPAYGRHLHELWGLIGACAPDEVCESSCRRNVYGRSPREGGGYPEISETLFLLRAARFTNLQRENVSCLLQYPGRQSRRVGFRFCGTRQISNP